MRQYTAALSAIICRMNNQMRPIGLRFGFNAEKCRCLIGPLLYVRAADQTWRTTTQLDCGITTNFMTISEKDFYRTNAQTTTSDLHTKELGTANPKVRSRKYIFNRAWICMNKHINDSTVMEGSDIETHQTDRGIQGNVGTAEADQSVWKRNKAQKVDQQFWINMYTSHLKVDQNQKSGPTFRQKIQFHLLAFGQAFNSSVSKFSACST